MNKKMCLVASSGGHMSELLKLSVIWQRQNAVFVTTTDVVRAKLQKDGAVYVVGECNRQNPWKTAIVFWRCLKTVIKEKPGVVISTGAATGFMVCLLGKCLGAKVVWLDSIANTVTLSMSGRMIRPFADLILSQWPEVAAKYPNVEYAGEVI